MLNRSVGKLLLRNRKPLLQDLGNLILRIKVGSSDVCIVFGKGLTSRSQPCLAVRLGEALQARSAPKTDPKVAATQLKSDQKVAPNVNQSEPRVNQRDPHVNQRDPTCNPK